MSFNALRLFALGASTRFGERVAEHLQVALSDLEERTFEDGEHKSRPLVSVRDRDVYVVHSLYGEPGASANDKLCRLLFFLGAVRDAAARRVTAVVPYLCYTRKDRRTKPRDPVTTRYVAALLEAVGADCVLTLDVHNLAAYENAYRRRTEHLVATGLFAQHFAGLVGDEPVAVVSPDAGGVGRADALREALGRAVGRPVGGAFLEKRRSEDRVSGEAVVGDVDGHVAVIVDDIIGTGTTMARAAQACRKRGAKRIFAAATHGLFTGGAGTLLEEPALERIVVTNTVPPFRLDPELVQARLEVLDVAPLFAEAVRRIHLGGSLVDLLEGGAAAGLDG